MPFLAGKNLKRSISHLAANLAIFNFKTTDILAVHRLPVKPGLTPADTRDRWLGALGKLGGLALEAAGPKPTSSTRALRSKTGNCFG